MFSLQEFSDRLLTCINVQNTFEKLKTIKSI